MRNYQNKPIWTNIEDLKNIKLIALPVNDDSYIKTKIRTYDDKVCTKFRGLIVPGDDTECESFTIISIDSLLVYTKTNITSEYIQTIGLIKF